MIKDKLPVTLNEQLILLGQVPDTKVNVLRAVGQLLVNAGMVDFSFISSMERREAIANTFLTAGVAVPHCQVEDDHSILEDSIAIVQVPRGVDWGDGYTVTLIVAIAAKTEKLLDVLKYITRVLEHKVLVEKLNKAQSAQELVDAMLSVPKRKSDLKLIQPKDLKHSFEWTIDYPAGLHARPSSVWVDCAKKAGLAIQIRHDCHIVSADNMVGLLQMGIRCGDHIVISADGDLAEEKLKHFKESIESLSLIEKNDAEHAKLQKQKMRGLGWKPEETIDTAILHGISASPGFVIGNAYSLMTDLPEVIDEPVPLQDGIEILNTAINASKSQILSLIDTLTERLNTRDAEIFKMHLTLLDDPLLINVAHEYMAEGHGVAWSWRYAVDGLVKQFIHANHGLLADKAEDLKDIGLRVLANIDPTLECASLQDIPDGEWILTASDLTPSDTILLDASKIKGLVTRYGGPTSHTAILARTLGIPAIVATGESISHVENGSLMIVDADSAMVYVSPTRINMASAEAWMKFLKEKHKEIDKARLEPAITVDGYRMTIGANVNQPAQVQAALENGAEGIGLMRTEFLFLDSVSAPTEEEQYKIYQEMMIALDGRSMIIRALDVGGDKKADHLRLPNEKNPFLGVRGSRLLLRRMDLLLPQLKAIYRVAKEGHDISIMFPMITSDSEILTLKSYCECVRLALKAPVIPIGIMVEVPSAAIMADVFAQHVDFFSIGTNDLTQYTLAIDRENTALAAEADSMHPAVLRLIKETIDGANKYNKPVGVCGGLAGDPFGAMILTGLGVQELSMTARDIPSVKAQLREYSLEQLQTIAAKALTLDSAVDVRALFNRE